MIFGRGADATGSCIGCRTESGGSGREEDGGDGSTSSGIGTVERDGSGLVLVIGFLLSGGTTNTAIAFSYGMMPELWMFFHSARVSRRMTGESPVP